MAYIEQCLCSGDGGRLTARQLLPLMGIHPRLGARDALLQVP